MDGTIQIVGTLTGQLHPTVSLVGVLGQPPTVSGAITVPQAVGVPLYDGTYEVTPMAHMEQVLETSGKRLIDDVTVLEIPYTAVANLYGGKTVTIGG